MALQPLSLPGSLPLSPAPPHPPHNTIRVTHVIASAFYWRVQRDYDDAPPPTVLLFHPRTDTLEDVRAKIEAARAAGGASRVVLQASEPHIPAAKHAIPMFLHAAKQRRTEAAAGAGAGAGARKGDAAAVRARAAAWAVDSVGLYPNFTSFADELLRYGQLPSLKGIRGLPLVDPVITHIRTCENGEKGRTLSNGQWVSAGLGRAGRGRRHTLTSCPPLPQFPLLLCAGARQGNK